MKLGFIGLKGHTAAVLAGAKQLGDVEIVAVSEDDPDLQASLLKRGPLFAKAQPYERWQHLVEHTLLDVCCVAGENGERIDQLLALLERGVHIISEKPLVTELADLARLRAAFRQSKSRLTMLLELRHQPKNVRVRELIQSGAIGEVCQVATQKSYQWGERADWLKSRSRLGGIIPYIGIHSLDTVRWVTGLDFTHVTAVQASGLLPSLGETEHQASILARLTNGASVASRLDYLRPKSAPTHSDDRLRVAGTKGVIEVNEGDDAVKLITQEKTALIPFGETENLFVEFAKYIQGGPPPRITAEDCFYITEVALRAREAAETASMVTLNC
jgi:predicted dehydrogenase